MTDTRAVHYPLRTDGGIGSLAVESDYERYVAQLIKQVLLTAPGERNNQPELGAGLRRMLFAPNNPATASLVKALILEALNRWLGRFIRTEAVQVDAEEE